jgi:hypothetical protein
MANAHWEARDFAFPTLEYRRWCRFVDTARVGDDAIVELQDLSPVVDPDRYRVESRSVAMLVSERGGG